jgi:DNA-binding response OmpR family regulator
MKILYVEDDQNVRESVASWIRQEGHQVVFAGGLCWVQHELEKDDFDAFICDGRLPDGSGYELAGRLSSQGRKVVMNTSDPRHVPTGVPCVHKGMGLGPKETARILLQHLGG